MELFLLILILLCVCGGRNSYEFDRSEGGYSNGFLASCPGSEKPAHIPKRILEQLQFVVEGKSRRRYPYSKAVRGLASDPSIDFKKLDTIIFVSGWMDFNTSPVTMVAGGAHAKLKKNVIVLETNAFTRFEYPIAARLSREVGRRVALVLAGLLEYGFNPKKTQIIGLSLGGHTIGFIAKHFKNITGISIGRLTGLDPAGPCFRTLPPEHRLNSTDADRVDVIHTNIDGLGMPTPMGHVDFYVNGGEYQANDIPTLPCTTFCSHLRALVLWLMTLDHPNSFIGLKCNSVQDARDENCYNNKPLVTNVVGPNTDFSKPGIFHLATSNIFPYHLGTKGLKEENNVIKSHISRLNKGDVEFSQLLF